MRVPLISRDGCGGMAPAGWDVLLASPEERPHRLDIVRRPHQSVGALSRRTLQGHREALPPIRHEWERPQQ